MWLWEQKATIMLQYEYDAFGTVFADSPCEAGSRARPGICCRRWSQTDAHTHSWHQRCPRRQQRQCRECWLHTHCMYGERGDVIEKRAQSSLIVEMVLVLWYRTSTVMVTCGDELKIYTYSLICRMAPNLPKMSYISSVVISKGRFLWKWVIKLLNH